YMASHLFRGYPARGQTYVAEKLEAEGWFDRDGWRIGGYWFPEDRFSNGSEARVGQDIDWAHPAWAKAPEMPRSPGTAIGVYLPPERVASLRATAREYEKVMGLETWAMPSELPADRRTPEMAEGYKAHNLLYWNSHFKNMTNFDHFYFSTQV